jgi:hypothetical protein
MKEAHLFRRVERGMPGGGPDQVGRVWQGLWGPVPRHRSPVSLEAPRTASEPEPKGRDCGTRLRGTQMNGSSIFST